MWFPLWPILICKMPQFWEKATDSDSPSYFSRNRHPEVTKNQYCFVPQGEPRKDISSFTNISVQRYLYLPFRNQASPPFIAVPSCLKIISTLR